MSQKEISKLIDWLETEEYEKALSYLKSIHNTEIPYSRNKKSTINKYQSMLSKNATKYELKFKEILIKNNIKFYFQKIFKVTRGKGSVKYIVDFYIPQNNVVIEIDGSQHNKENNISKDSIRTEGLLTAGVSKVIRLSNKEVNEDSEKMIKIIEKLKKEAEGLQNLM
jgi:very-short-patch-repair endonuclease